jgi:putative transposase
MPDILPVLLALTPVLPKTTCRQLHRIVLSMLAMTGRITQLGLSRWTDKGGSYRSVQRFFHTPIDWLEVKWRFFALFLYDPDGVYLLVGDESVVGKAGKHTFGLDRFFSSLADKAIAGIACFSMALVHTNKRQAYSLCTEQVVRTQEEKEQARQRTKQRKPSSAKKQPQKPRGRPKGSKNKNRAEVALSPELERILAQGQKVLERIQTKMSVTYFVLDGHFGNHPAYQMVRRMHLHLISKMRSNAALFLEPTPAQKAQHPRLKYGAKLDYAALPEALLCRRRTEDGYRTEVYQARCRHKDFAERLNVVILVKTNLSSGRVGHIVLFSSDLSLDAEQLIDYYSLRFQIEFTFRDAKQHFGLEDFMGVTKTAVANGIGLSFFMVNLATYLLEPLRARFAEAGVNDLKCYYRGRHYAAQIIKCLPDRPDAITCVRLAEQLSRLGCIHSPGKSAPNLERAA